MHPLGTWTKHTHTHTQTPQCHFLLSPGLHLSFRYKPVEFGSEPALTKPPCLGCSHPSLIPLATHPQSIRKFGFSSMLKQRSCCFHALVAESRSGLISVLVPALWLVSIRGDSFLPSPQLPLVCKIKLATRTALISAFSLSWGRTAPPVTPLPESLIYPAEVDLTVDLCVFD